MFVFLFFLPFSPRWLAGKGRDQEALEVLCFLRRLPVSDPRVQAEWITIRAEAVHNRESLVARHPTLKGRKGFKVDTELEGLAWIDMFKPNVIRRTMIGIGIMFFQQFVGINAVRLSLLPFASRISDSRLASSSSTTRPHCLNSSDSTTSYSSSCRAS